MVEDRQVGERIMAMPDEEFTAFKKRFSIDDHVTREQAVLRCHWGGHPGLTPAKVYQHLGIKTVEERNVIAAEKSAEATEVASRAAVESARGARESGRQAERSTRAAESSARATWVAAVASIISVILSIVAIVISLKK